MRLTIVLKWTALGAFGLLLLTWITAVLAPLALGRLDAIAGVATLVVVFALAALACAVTLEQGRLVVLLYSGVATSGLSVIGWGSFAILQPAMSPAAEEAWLVVLLPLACWTGFCAVVGLLWQRRQPHALGVWLRRATVVGAALVAAGVLVRTKLDRWMSWSQQDMVERVLGGLTVLTLVGLLITMILARLRQLETGGAEDSPRLPFQAKCPRCGLRQSMTTGGDGCRHCGLRITVIVP